MAAANRLGTIRQRVARGSRVVMNAIGLSRSIKTQLHVFEANSEFTDLPRSAPHAFALLRPILAMDNPQVQQKVAKMQHPCKARVRSYGATLKACAVAKTRGGQVVTLCGSTQARIARQQAGCFGHLLDIVEHR